MVCAKQVGIKYHFWVFSMTWHEIEPQSPEPLVNILTIMPMDEIKIVTGKNNCLLSVIIIIIIITYLKVYNCVQTNDYYQIKIVPWNHIIVHELVLDRNIWNH